MWWLFRPDDFISKDELIATIVRLITNRYNDLTWSNRADNYTTFLDNHTTVDLSNTARWVTMQVVYNLYKENNFILEDSGYILK